MYNFLFLIFKENSIKYKVDIFLFDHYSFAASYDRDQFTNIYYY